MIFPDFVHNKHGVASSIAQQKTIMNDFLFERRPIHLKSLQHRSAAVKQYFSFKQPFRGRKLTLNPARSFRAVNTERHKHASRLALTYDLEEPFETE
jgi:hypothetical protein